MILRTGNGQRLRVNLGGQVYKIKSIAEFYVQQIITGNKTIEDVPEELKEVVTEMLPKD